MSGLDLKLEPERAARRVEIINGIGGRRRWSADDKARIVEETLAAGAVVSDIVRRHGLTPQQLFTWCRHSSGCWWSAGPNAPAGPARMSSCRRRPRPG